MKTPAQEGDSSKRPRPSSVSIDHGRHGLIRAAVRLVRKRTGRHLTVRQLVADAVDSWIRQIERDYNDGRPLDPDTTPMPPGRNIDTT